MKKSYSILKKSASSVAVIRYDVASKKILTLDMTVGEAVRFSQIAKIEYTNAKIENNQLVMIVNNGYHYIAIARIPINNSCYYVLIDKHKRLTEYEYTDLIDKINNGAVIQNLYVKDNEIYTYSTIDDIEMVV